jgi:hypothetical protein
VLPQLSRPSTSLHRVILPNDVCVWRVFSMKTSASSGRTKRLFHRSISTIDAIEHVLYVANSYSAYRFFILMVRLYIACLRKDFWLHEHGYIKFSLMLCSHGNHTNSPQAISLTLTWYLVKPNRVVCTGKWLFDCFRPGTVKPAWNMSLLSSKPSLHGKLKFYNLDTCCTCNLRTLD